MERMGMARLHFFFQKKIPQNLCKRDHAYKIVLYNRILSNSSYFLFLNLLALNQWAFVGEWAIKNYH